MLDDIAFFGEDTKMAEILEVIMMVSFGASWPLNVVKSYKARTTKGKSLTFLLLILFGYAAEIISLIGPILFKRRKNNEYFVDWK